MLKVELALIICDPGQNRETIVASALACGLSAICCSNAAEARVLLPQGGFKLVFCTEVLSDGDFRTVLRETRKVDPYLSVIVLSHAGDWDFYLKALAAGAFDLVLCPPNPFDVERIICLALAQTIDTEVESRVAA